MKARIAMLVGIGFLLLGFPFSLWLLPYALINGNHYLILVGYGLPYFVIAVMAVLFVLFARSMRKW